MKNGPNERCTSRALFGSTSRTLTRQILNTRSFSILLLVPALACAPRDAKQSTLRWGGDAEGGAPFVEADPADPSKVRGFDVEIAEALAKGLGRTPQFVQVAFQSIDQSAQRGDFDIGLSGMEDTPARRAA